MITTSILKARGFENLVDIQYGWNAMEENENIAKTDYVCPTTIPQEEIDKAVEAVI